MHELLELFLLEPKLLRSSMLCCCLVDIRGYGVLGYGYAGLGLYVDMEVRVLPRRPVDNNRTVLVQQPGPVEFRQARTTEHS